MEQDLVEQFKTLSIEEPQALLTETTPSTKPPRHYRLLILDLNGILICRRYEKNRDLEPPKGAYREGNFFVWLRPGLEQFLDFIFQHFEVGVWSSVMKHNIEPLAKAVFGKYYERLFFIMDQDYCQKLQNPEIDPKTGKPSAKPLFRKNLYKVWAFFDLKDRYSAKNTLIIDDSDEKMVNNPKECHFNPGTWTVSETIDLTPEYIKQQAALMPRGFIRTYLEKYVADTEEYCQSLQTKYNK